ncbi:MAG: hypothetical protein HC803_02215 [Saprospiraceae bacterium]|nr:hypothetical protein [Saprospiraceae bacterium]
MNKETKTAREIREERMPTYEKYIKWMWRLLFAGIASVILLFGGLALFGGIPSTERLEIRILIWQQKYFQVTVKF